LFDLDRIPQVGKVQFSDRFAACLGYGGNRVNPAVDAHVAELGLVAHSAEGDMTARLPNNGGCHIVFQFPNSSGLVGGSNRGEDSIRVLPFGWLSFGTEGLRDSKGLF
jgi:hypothetical protein